MRAVSYRRNRVSQQEMPNLAQSGVYHFQELYGPYAPATRRYLWSRWMREDVKSSFAVLTTPATNALVQKSRQMFLIKKAA